MTPAADTHTSDHRRVLETLGLPAAAVERLARYLDLLARWNERANLTGASTAEERVGVLVGAVLPALPLALPGRLIDVGSGNGSPGLIFAAVREDIDVTLLEPRAKRYAFLREAARQLGRPGVSVERCRHDGYDGPPAATVTLRALALPLAALRPLIAPGGRVLVCGREPHAENGFRPLPDGTLPGCWVFERCST
jgi:16S rRNA (guanine527-N7)-methyltransferase